MATRPSRSPDRPARGRLLFLILPSTASLSPRNSLFQEPALLREIQAAIEALQTHWRLHMAKILLTGANGQVSTAAIAALKGTGHEIFGLVRDPSKGERLGIELRVGELDRPRSLEGAFDGIDTAFLLAGPSEGAPYQMSNALWAAKQAGVKHVVRMSAIGAAPGAPGLNGRLHALSDRELEVSGLPYTILQPHFFWQNLLFAASTIAQEGAMYWALGEAALPGIDVEDVGAVTARILANPGPHAGKTYTLTGGEAITLHQVATAIGEAAGKRVKYVPIPLETMVEGLSRSGIGDYSEVAYRDYMALYARGWQSQPTDTVKRILGRSPRSIADFAHRHADAFKSSAQP
jgi:uncharacterized protein YbjT (DUF2867 family)